MNGDKSERYTRVLSSVKPILLCEFIIPRQLSAVVILHEKGRWGGVGDYPAYIRTRAGTVAMVPLSALKAEGFS